MTVLVMAQVRMLTSIAGEYTADEGEVLSLQPEEAARWVTAGIAEWWDDPLATAMRAGAPEQAMRPRGRARG